MSKKAHLAVATVLVVATARVQCSATMGADPKLRSPVVDTGQKECYDNYRRIACPRQGERFCGQDAQYDGLQMSYRDNGDGTITDAGTGLMWTKSDSGTTHNWEQALSYAEKLECAGYDDWRLPNAKELLSIVDYTRAPDATDPAGRGPAIDPVFDLTETESWFWTSTTHGDNLFGVYVCFGRAFSAWQWGGRRMNAHGAGAQRSDPKTGDPARYGQGLGPKGDEVRIYNYVRCVRDAGCKPADSSQSSR